MMVKRIPTGIKLAGYAFIILTLIFILAPLVVVIAVSFSKSQFIAFPPSGLSLRWYQEVLSSQVYLTAAARSLEIAVLVTATATAIGGAGAVALNRRLLPASGILSTFFLSPLVLPTIIYAIGLLMLWSATVGQPSIAAIWIGHTVIALPYVIRTTLAVLSDADPFLEEAARTMGAGRLQRLFHVVLPQCFPGLAAGAFFAFNISFDEAVVSLFLRTPDLVTLPIQIYSKLEFSPDPSVAAVSSLMIFLAIILIVAIDRLLGIRRFASA